MVQIIPSLLTSDEETFTRQLTAVQSAVDMIQIDIADGIFVPNTTWADPDIVSKIASVDIELHLMVHNPVEELEQWTAVKQIKRVLFHYESFSKDNERKEAIAFAKSYHWQVGLVLNPDTPAEVLNAFQDDIDSIMVMGVVPGFQGQPFENFVLEKIKQIKQMAPAHMLSIDGAVNKTTLYDILQTGIDAICPGSAIFGNDQNPAENVHQFAKWIHEYTTKKQITNNK